MKNEVQKIREAVERLKSQLLIGACSSQVAMETRCKEEAYNEVLAILDTMQEELVSKDYRERYKNIAQSDAFKSAYENKSLGEVMSVEGEEPVSEELDAASIAYAEAFMKDVNRLEIQQAKWHERHPEEPVIQGGIKACFIFMRNAFMAGAKWQKEQDESTTKDLGDYINKLSKQFPEVSFAKLSRIAVRVAKWQKQQDQETIELAEDHAMLAGMEKMKEEMMKEPNLSGYVARDEDGNLHVFEVEPRRLEEKHRWWDRDYNCHIIDNDAFPDLRWEDEPICVKLIIIKED